MSSSMPWFRYYGSEVLGDNKFPRIARILQLDKLQIIGAWSLLLSMASDSPVRGSLRITLRARYAIEDIAEVFGWETQTTEMLIDNFIDLDMVFIDEDGAFCIKNWDKRQYISDLKDPTAAKRMQDMRDKQSRYADVTRSLRPDTESDTESDTDKSNKNTTPLFIIPEILNKTEFINSWEAWIKYRSEIKHKITKSTADKQLKKLSTYPVNTAIRMIEQSIENGWQGIFEVKSNDGRRKSTYQETINECARKRGIILDEFQILKPEGEIIDV